MSDDKIAITKLAADGGNWISYRDRMIWAFDNKRWSEHLTSAVVPTTWAAIGTVTPQERWDAEESSAKILIAASLPDHIFNRIKTKTNTKEIWDAIKEIYQKRSKMITVDLGRKLTEYQPIARGICPAASSANVPTPAQDETLEECSGCADGGSTCVYHAASRGLATSESKTNF